MIDTESNSAVYVVFSSRVNKDDDNNKSRFSSSLCAISLDDAAASPVPVAPKALP